MTIEHVLAVIPVRDLTSAVLWYEQLFGKPADNRPMDTLAEWQVIPTGWVQVTADPSRAGTALLNLAVDDISAHLQVLADRELDVGPIETVNNGVQLAAVLDPDGNRLTFIGHFRTAY
jgi:predicted enzyme related to lactoylglutathione lyase